VRFKVVVDKKSIKNLTNKANMGSCDNCTATHTLTNQGTNATSIADAIISFYFDKNLKQSEQKAR